MTTGIKDYISNIDNVNSNKIIVVSNGVDEKKFKPSENIKASTNVYTLGYVGSLKKFQGIDYIINSTKLVIDSGYKCNLVIIGDGPFKSHLILMTKELGIQNNVYFLNHVSYKDIPKYINSFDICLSYHVKLREKIVSPFKIFEYLACGKPVIASNLHGIADFFKDNCIYAEPENARDLADKIIFLIKNEEYRKLIGINARKFILSKYTWGNICKIINYNLHKLTKNK